MEGRVSRVEHRFERPLLVAALLVIPALVLEESDVGAPWSALATALDWGIWLAFLSEVVVMLAIVPSRRSWLRHHLLDVAIVVLTPPFLPALLQGLRAVRLVRMLRVLRLGATVTRSRRFFSMRGVRYVGFLTGVVVLGGGAAFSAVEHRDAWDGLYWAVTTATTVGYGDVPVKTSAGRVIAMTVMLVSIGFLAVVTAAIAQRFVATAVEEAIEGAVEPLTADDDAVLAEIGEIRARLVRLEEVLRAQRA